MKYSLATAITILLGCGNSLGAADFTLSFEERGRYESVKAPGNWLLQVWVEGRKVHEIDLVGNGPQWNEQVAFTVNDPGRMRLAFRLASKRPAADDPEIEIGNVRVKDARGGEVAMEGKWVPFRTDSSFLLHSWSYDPLPAFRNGFGLRHVYGIRSLDEKQYGEWRFEGRLASIANLQIRRLFEYAGCYEKLNFYDDWQKVSFTPGRPKAGDQVSITAKVRNAGSLDVQGAKVSLFVDGKLVDRKDADIPAVSETQVSFPSGRCFG